MSPEESARYWSDVLRGVGKHKEVFSRGIFRYREMQVWICQPKAQQIAELERWMTL